MKQISCEKCGYPMPKLRKTQYGYEFCVSCSEKYNLVSKLRGVSVQMGEGDHTWIETIFMNEEEYKKYINPEGNPEITFGIEDA
jgi:uncharacterized Zn finger protein (UPF0148 family)